MLHPWAVIVGVLAVGLPVLIHRLTRPRPVRLPISTLRFIQDALRQRRTVHRLRDAIILGLRALAVLLLALAVARPMWGRRDKPLVAAEPAGDTVRIVLLDVSESMSARENGVEVFEKARPAAAKYLAQAQGLRANLILAGARPRAVFERPSANVAALRDELAGVRPRPERLNLQAALTMAARLLSQGAAAGGQRRELVVISDFQKTSWADADFRSMPSGTRIEMAPVAPASVPGNLAVLGVNAEGRAERGAEIKINAEVGNYSPTPRQVQVDITLAGSTGRASGLCPAFGEAVLSCTVTPSMAGWLAGEARLIDADDAMPADNVRPFVVNVRPPTTYVMVTRQRDTVDSSASYYLERALVPDRPREGRGGERVVRVDPTQLDAEGVAPADLVVVTHPGKMPSKTVELLSSCVRRGRPLLYVAAEDADAANLKMLTEAIGGDTRLPVEFLPPTAGHPRRDLKLADVRGDTAAFRLFGDSLSAAIAPLRFAGGLETRAIQGGLADDVWASYGDRSAFLTVVSHGAASLAVLNADLAVSNLPASPVFVPVIQELSAALISGRNHGHDLRCGEPASVPLPAEIANHSDLRVVPPAGVDETGVLVLEGGRRGVSVAGRRRAGRVPDQTRRGNVCGVLLRDPGGRERSALPGRRISPEQVWVHRPGRCAAGNRRGRHSRFDLGMVGGCLRRLHVARTGGLEGPANVIWER